MALSIAALSRTKLQSCTCCTNDLKSQPFCAFACPSHDRSAIVVIFERIIHSIFHGNGKAQFRRIPAFIHLARPQVSAVKLLKKSKEVGPPRFWQKKTFKGKDSFINSLCSFPKAHQFVQNQRILYASDQSKWDIGYSRALWRFDLVEDPESIADLWTHPMGQVPRLHLCGIPTSVIVQTYRTFNSILLFKILPMLSRFSRFVSSLFLALPTETPSEGSEALSGSLSDRMSLSSLCHALPTFCPA